MYDPHWMAVCCHEAAHAVVAQKMGLTVEWVQLAGEDGGIQFAGAVKIPDSTLVFPRDTRGTPALRTPLPRWACRIATRDSVQRGTSGSCWASSRRSSATCSHRSPETNEGRWSGCST
jgi:hypothetical protein